MEIRSMIYNVVVQSVEVVSVEAPSEEAALKYIAEQFKPTDPVVLSIAREIQANENNE
jgi:hypothetical protein